MLKTVGLIAGALALGLATFGSIGDADARGGYRGGGGGYRGYYGGYGGGYGYGYRGPGIGFYAAPAYYYGDRCAGLRAKARATGSRYWWNRYESCRVGY